MSQFLNFSLENLKELDGAKANKVMDELIRAATRDCMERPAEKKAREVTLKVVLKPVYDEVTHDCEEVKVQIKFASTIPASQTKEYSFGTNRKGQLLFNPDSPNNVNQGTLLDADGNPADD